MDRFNKLESKKVFDFFYEISQIPRESKKEEKISNYLKKFAQERNLWVKQDEVKNIVIKKEGTGKLKDAQPVVLQAHMDMVCEKGKDSKHNFDTDPIEWVIKDDFIYANDTTLGADDGIGVAYALALLDDDNIVHPPLEVVLTMDEETGMTGANNLDVKDLDGKIFINIDTEEEGRFYLSCAGGNDTQINIPVAFREYEGLLVDIEVSGLVGGHSGLEIIQERANASKVMGRFLNMLAMDNIKFNLVEINGGSKINAITRDCNAKIIIDEKDFSKIEAFIKQLNEDLKIEYTPQDPDAHISATKKENNKYQAMNLEDSLRVVYALVLIPYGPFTRSQYIEDLVQTSANIGVVETQENNVLLASALRSSVVSQKQALIEQYEVLAKLIGANVESGSFYPAWPFNDKSKIKDLFVREYKKLFNKEPEIVAIHAGLECGLFKEKMSSDVDFISVGPDIFGAHTAEERLSISSTERTWKLLKEVLASIDEY
ncbi:dipeptidase D [Bacilli bacterium PM5-3]|nr:dipeptidase D [Bacilli bacterium PM5-3]MDH6603931.1 dipeptidase D [Bacilli bacterium PM5-9]